MPTTIFDLGADYADLKYRQPFITEGTNKKVVGAPHGILQGGKLTTSGSLMSVTIEADPDTGYSIYAYEGRSGTLGGLRVVDTGSRTLNLTAVASTTVYVCLYVEYTTTTHTVVQFRTYSESELFTSPVTEAGDVIILGKVVVPGSGSILASAITGDRRTGAWQGRSPEARDWQQVVLSGSVDVPVEGLASNRVFPYLCTTATGSATLTHSSTQKRSMTHSYRFGGTSGTLALSPASGYGTNATWYPVRAGQRINYSFYAKAINWTYTGTSQGILFAFRTSLTSGVPSDTQTRLFTNTNDSDWVLVTGVVETSADGWMSWVITSDADAANIGYLYIDDIKMWLEAGKAAEDTGPVNLKGINRQIVGSTLELLPAMLPDDIETWANSAIRFINKSDAGASDVDLLLTADPVTNNSEMNFNIEAHVSIVGRAGGIPALEVEGDRKGASFRALSDTSDYLIGISTNVEADVDESSGIGLDATSELEDIRKSVAVAVSGEVEVEPSTGGQGGVALGVFGYVEENDSVISGSFTQITASFPNATITATSHGLTSDHVGLWIKISAAAAVGNPGIYKIISTSDPNAIQYTNPAATTETVSGNWYVGVEFLAGVEGLVKLASTEGVPCAAVVGAYRLDVHKPETGATGYYPICQEVGVLGMGRGAYQDPYFLYAAKGTGVVALGGNSIGTSHGVLAMGGGIGAIGCLAVGSTTNGTGVAASGYGTGTAVIAAFADGVEPTTWNTYKQKVGVAACGRDDGAGGVFYGGENQGVGGFAIKAYPHTSSADSGGVFGLGVGVGNGIYGNASGSGAGVAGISSGTGPGGSFTPNAARGSINLGVRTGDPTGFAGDLYFSSAGGGTLKLCTGPGVWVTVDTTP